MASQSAMPTLHPRRKDERHGRPKSKTSFAPDQAIVDHGQQTHLPIPRKRQEL